MAGGRKIWKLSFGGQRWIASAGPAIPPSALNLLVDRAFGDPAGQRALLEIAAELNGGPLNGSTGNVNLRKAIEMRLQEAFRQGRLHVIPQELGGVSTDREAFAEAEQIAEREIETERQRMRERQALTRSTEKTFIEIVLENQKGDPVPNALCHLKLTDGRLLKEKLDSEGRLRVPGIDPGQCQVSFPEFDAGEWKQI